VAAALIRKKSMKMPRRWPTDTTRCLAFLEMPVSVDVLRQRASNIWGIMMMTFKDV
jgi:hypothetical protein